MFRKRAVVAVLIGCFLSATAPAEEKLPAPTTGVLKDTIKQVTEVYKAEFAAAQTPEQKLALSKKLLNAGRGETDTNGKFVILTRAREFAMEAADFGAAVEAIDELGRTFEVPEGKLKVEAAQIATRGLRSPDQRRNFFSTSANTVLGLVKREDFESAKAICALEQTQAQATGDGSIVAEVQARQKSVRDAEGAFAEAKRAAAVLEKTPDNPEANYKVGFYRCAYRAEWDANLPLLAKGNNEAMKKAAEQEIKGAQTMEEKIKIGDDWWTIGAPMSGMAKLNVWQHAAKWYEKGMAELTDGLLKSRVDKRMAELRELTTPTLPLMAEERAYIGKWVVNAGNGQGDFVITVNPDRTAVNTRDKAATGAWEVVKGDIKIKWSNGWTDVIAIRGASASKTSFAPGKETPYNYSGAKKTQ